MAEKQKDFSVEPNCATWEGKAEVSPEQDRIYSGALQALKARQVPFLIGGAFAHHAFTGIWRDTKDLDLFLKPEDVDRALEVLGSAGFETELTDLNWLAKAWVRPYFIDLIFGMGNRALRIDDDWIGRGLPIRVCGVGARLIAIEELIVSKVYIAKRDRFDGADVAHLIRSVRGEIDWGRVVELLGPNRDLLFWHWVLFDFVYPGHPEYLPQDMMVEMFASMQRRWSEQGATGKQFRGTLLDDRAFAVDVKHWGYRSADEEAEELS